LGRAETCADILAAVGTLTEVTLMVFIEKVSFQRSHYKSGSLYPARLAVFRKKAAMHLLHGGFCESACD
jgi:hypothetical protein